MKSKATIQKIKELVNSEVLNNHDYIVMALVGSYNYNVNTSNSDKDYKIILMPTFQDLYYNKKMAGTANSITQDVSWNSLREFPTMLYKSNIAVLEMLFADTIVNSRYVDIWNYFINLRNDITVMNLPYLYNSCMGMIYNAKKKLVNNESNIFPVSVVLPYEHNYNIKSATKIYRMYDFITRFVESDFDFETAYRYKNNEESRQILLRIKNGYCNNIDISMHLSYVEQKAREKESIYMSHIENKKLYTELKEKTYWFIYNKIKEM